MAPFRSNKISRIRPLLAKFPNLIGYSRKAAPSEIQEFISKKAALRLTYFIGWSLT